MLSLEGRQLGNYDVTKRIRVGGMGAVYEGRQRTAFDRRVAIKVILGNYAADREMRRRFAREARTIARLHHPHILPLIEFGDEKGILYLVMPFIEGGTLTSYLRRSLPDLGEVSAIYQQLLDAVECAHDEGLIHRDIKSSNVLLEQHRSGPPYIYLADFGLVRTARQADTSQVGKPIPLDQVPGTPHYMAPEQTRGIVTPLTDIYALGVLLYQLLTGELPYNDPDDVQIIQMHLHAPIPSPCDRDTSIPPELGEVVRVAMAKQPEARYGNVAQLRAAFLSALEGQTSTAFVQDEEPTLEPVYVPPKRPTPVPLNLQGPVAPAVAQRRLRNESALTTIRERKRSTDTIKNKQHNIDEPTKRSYQHRRFSWQLIVAVMIPVLLLILLILPRMLQLNIFPPDIPILGTPLRANVSITPLSKILQDRYVLAASPQFKIPDLVSHTIPDRVIQSGVTNSILIQTTGTKLVAGVQSHGTIVFLNASTMTITVPASLAFQTSTGVHVQLIQSVKVPPRQGGIDGSAQAEAIVVESGTIGNIAAHSLDSTCCNNELSLQNPAAFTGGADASIAHLVTQTDLDGARNALVPSLQQQVIQQLQRQLDPDEAMIGQPNYTVTVTSASPVGAQTTQVRVTASVSGSVTVYNHNIAERTAIQLLSKQATQVLGSAYQLQGLPKILAPPSIEQGKGGTIYLSLSVRGLWIYALSAQQTDQWRQAIKGFTSEQALTYLKSQPGVAVVRINLSVNGAHLPTQVENIKIVLQNP